MNKLKASVDKENKKNIYIVGGVTKANVWNSYTLYFLVITYLGYT